MSYDLFTGAMKWTGLSREDITKIVATAPRRYKTYTIPKRNGGTRTIAQPSRELKEIQYFLIERLLSELAVHKAATAYVKGVGLQENALRHSQNSYLLKMDFVDFFGSIKAEDFEVYCRQNSISLSTGEVNFCRKVLFYESKRNSQLQLSIGAPSSPLLSNIIMKNFDEIVNQKCLSIDITYTRYADDLTFSSDKIEKLMSIRSYIPELLSVLPFPKIYVNWDKVVLISKKSRRTVTGLVLSNDSEVSLGRERKRLIRAMINHFKSDKLGDLDTQKLKGWMAYAKGVEPKFFQSMIGKYGSSTISKLLSTPKVGRKRVGT